MNRDREVRQCLWGPGFCMLHVGRCTYDSATYAYVAAAHGVVTGVVGTLHLCEMGKEYNSPLWMIAYTPYLNSPTFLA